MLNDFITWFEKDSPNFVVKYGEARKFYDSQSDTFMITEIQEAYEEFKGGDEPNSLYWSWERK